MKAFFAFSVFALSAHAQVHAVAFAPAARPAPHYAVQSKAYLNAGSRPLGGVALPTFPSGNVSRHGNRGGRPIAPYFGPVIYVPNGFDASYDTAYDPAPPPPAEQPAPRRFYRPVGDSGLATQPSEASAAMPGDPLADPENYYLIAYKDHSVYPALAYWLEGETLHYVTTRNTHNQASLALIDVDQTTRLNADRSVPFTIPGR